MGIGEKINSLDRIAFRGLRNRLRRLGPVVPLEPAVDRKALAGEVVGTLSGEVERQPEYVPRFSR